MRFQKLLCLWTQRQQWFSRYFEIFLEEYRDSYLLAIPSDDNAQKRIEIVLHNFIRICTDGKKSWKSISYRKDRVLSELGKHKVAAFSNITKQPFSIHTSPNIILKEQKV